MDLGHRPARLLAVSLSIALGAAPCLAAPKSVLHYYANGGNDSHDSAVAACTAVLDQMSAELGFRVRHGRQSSELLQLGDYDLIIFDNTSQAAGMVNAVTAPQQALLDYMSNGGRLLALHAAADHLSLWNWYDTVLFSGAQYAGKTIGPFAVYRDTSASSRSDGALSRMWEYARDSLHIRTDSIPFDTERYHFNIDVRGKPSVQVLQVSGSIPDSDGTRESFGWTKEMPGGGRMLYTPLGGTPADWTQNQGWLRNAMWAYMRYLVGDFDATAGLRPPGIRIRRGRIELPSSGKAWARVSDLQGRCVASGDAAGIGGTALRPGVYIVTVGTSGAHTAKVVAIP